MKKILIVQASIFLFLLLISLATQGTPWLPIMILIAIIIGPFMAYGYPWDSSTHLLITIGFLLAIFLLLYGFKYRTYTKGIVAFILGFWLWVYIAFVFGLGTGT